MKALLFPVIVVVGSFLQREGSTQQPPDRQPAQKIDGQWTVVYAEMEGKALAEKSVVSLTIQNNVVTCKHDGKEMSWRLSFGPNHTVFATDLTNSGGKDPVKEPRVPDAHTHRGVYIASQEYLCLSFDKGPFAKEDRIKERDRQDVQDRPGAQGQAQIQPQFDGKMPYGSSLVFILRRGNSSGK